MTHLLGLELVKLTIKQEQAMSNWRFIAEQIYAKDISAALILSLLAYEAQHYRRTHVVKRLVARFHKVIAQEFDNKLAEDLSPWMPSEMLKNTLGIK